MFVDLKNCEKNLTFEGTPIVNRVDWHLWAVLVVPSVFSCQSENHSWPVWQLERWQDYQMKQNLFRKKKIDEKTIYKYTNLKRFEKLNYLPKHLL